MKTDSGGGKLKYLSLLVLRAGKSVNFANTFKSDKMALNSLIKSIIVYSEKQSKFIVLGGLWLPDLEKTC
jgi:hypothetical protein